MKFDNLVCERAGDVLKVVLNRPTKLNSLSLGLLRDLQDPGCPRRAHEQQHDERRAESRERH